MHTYTTYGQREAMRNHATPMEHMTHYTKAMAFIQSHGHLAAITKDGLLIMSLEMAPVYGDVIDNDWVYEVPMVFEVDELGMVSSREVRNWLGY